MLRNHSSTYYAQWYLHRTCMRFEESFLIFSRNDQVKTHQTLVRSTEIQPRMSTILGHVLGLRVSWGYHRTFGTRIAIFVSSPRFPCSPMSPMYVSGCSALRGVAEQFTKCLKSLRVFHLP